MFPAGGSSGCATDERTGSIFPKQFKPSSVNGCGQWRERNRRGSGGLGSGLAAECIDPVTFAASPPLERRGRRSSASQLVDRRARPRRGFPKSAFAPL